MPDGGPLWEGRREAEGMNGRLGDAAGPEMAGVGRFLPGCRREAAEGWRGNLGVLI